MVKHWKYFFQVEHTLKFTFILIVTLTISKEEKIETTEFPL